MSDEERHITEIYNNLNRILCQAYEHKEAPLFNNEWELLDASMNQLGKWIDEKYDMEPTHLTDEDMKAER